MSAARTRHVDADGRPLYTNALVDSHSPYLLQHAHNPVDWRPWGEAAFSEAQRRAVPIFLSVGYSTCHWCHVMERESFEDEEIAAVLNARFVPVKVDREVRPDVDAVYMAFLQRTTGGGGWPMSVWLTPEGRPLFAGTYFPARDGDRGTRRGFLSLLRTIDRNWRSPGFQAQADPVIAALRETPRPSGEVPPVEALAGGEAIFERLYDPRWGGFGRAPKFPRPSVLDMLLRAWHRHGRATGDRATLDRVAHTLTRMYCGGLYDHVGGGFARYSTDDRWRVPHFEKMLYDNAQLMTAYTEAWQATGDEIFARVVHDGLGWLDGQMSAPGGGFWSATDADSADADGEMHEGLFCVWTPSEIDAALPPADADWIKQTFGIRPEGDLDGRSVPHLSQPLDPAQWRRWAALRPTLRTARARRAQPGLDDKVVAAWNGLTISAFARAGMAFGRRGWIARAVQAADFVLTHMRVAGRLHRTWRRGVLGPPAVLEDHSHLILALLDLLEATGDVRWLDDARALQQILDDRFADPAGGYFRTAADGEHVERLLFREKPQHDGAEPGGNSQAALGLSRLAEITGEGTYRRRAEATLRALGHPIMKTPHAVPRALCALDRLHAEVRTVIIVTPRDEDPADAADRLWADARRRFGPHTVRLFGPAGGPLARRVPLFDGRVARDGQATAYVCVGTTCDLPTHDPATLAGQLDATKTEFD